MSDDNAAVSRRAVCQHCLARFASRPRGLCSICYYTPAVRPLYLPRTNDHDKIGVRAAPDGNRCRPHAPTPTHAAPGTLAKLLVLTERVAAGYRPHHPDDLGFHWQNYREDDWDTTPQQMESTT